MAKVQVLRALVEQRLSAAVEEIFVLFERTIAEYEEELCRSKQENQRQRKLLDALLNPRVLLQRAECVRSQEAPTGQQEWSSSQDQKDADPPPVKEELQNAWTTHGGEQLQGPEEFKFIAFPVKSEHNENEGKPLFSQLQQGQPEEDRGAEPPASSSSQHMETDTDGGPEPDRNTHSDRHLQPDTNDKTSESSDTEDSEDEQREKKLQSGLNSKNNGCNTARKPFSCSECDKTFRIKAQLKTHMRTHTGERPYSCSICSKGFTQKGNLTRHLATHRDETSLKCIFCGTRFNWLHQVVNHRCVGESSELTAGCETGKEQISSSVCGERLPSETHLKLHMTVHSGEKLLRCSVCEEPFRLKNQLKRHMTTHSGEKPYKCSVCDRCFTWSDTLAVHMRKHAEDNTFSCPLCEASFRWKYSFGAHMRAHGCKDPFRKGYRRSIGKRRQRRRLGSSSKPV